MAKKNLNKIKTDVMDLLNQIIVLTKGLPDVPTQEDDYTGAEIMLTSDYVDFEDADDLEANGVDTKIFPDGETLDAAVYLTGVSAYCERVVDGDADSVAHNEKQYYTSNC